VINGDKLAKRTVTVGQIKNQYIEVKEGLTEEDTIVVEGSSNMKDNGKFNIVRSN
jgi:multidrug efflux pump subunit AcrA (membrane-fusion protein)